jgi:hypothetical protein
MWVILLTLCFVCGPQTLDTYDGTSHFLSDLSKELSPSSLANAIIGMIGDMDSPMSPDQKGFTSMDRCVILYEKSYHS